MITCISRYTKDYILAFWVVCVRTSPAQPFSSSLPKVVLYHKSLNLNTKYKINILK